MRGTEEARQREDQQLAAAGIALGLAREAGLQHGLDALHVEELEVQGAAAGGVEPAAAVLVAEAQELLGLAQLRPREGSREELLGEAAHVLAHAPGLADHGLRVPHGVGRELGRVVAVVGRAAAGRLALVDLHALAGDVDADELRVAAHPDALAHVAGRDGVDGLLELDVVVAVDLALGPARRIEARALERPQRGLLHVEER